MLVGIGVTQTEVSNFLINEANTLDDRNLDGWLKLLADDISYKVRAREIIKEPELSSRAAEEVDTSTLTYLVMDESKDTLALRIKRFQTGYAHSDLPASFCVRSVSDIEIVDGDATEGLRVRSNIFIFENRASRKETLFVGRRVDVIRLSDSGLLLARRDVQLAHTVLPKTLSVFF